MYKIICPEKIEEAGEEFLSRRGYQIITLNSTDSACIRESLADADAAIIRFGATIDTDLLSSAPRLKVVARHGVGYNNIDAAAAEKLGIFVTNARGANTNSVAEQALMLILCLAKKIPAYKNSLENGEWNSRNNQKTEELQGKTLGLIGLGANGSRLAKMAHDGLDMQIIGFDPYVRKELLPPYIKVVESLDEVCRDADIVSLHCLLTKETHHCISSRELEMMKTSAWLINCARGPLVDTEALYEALKNGQIAAAGLDVYEEEPPAGDHPLYHLKNFMGTLHQASNSKEASDRCALFAAEDVDRILNHQVPKYAVNHPDMMLHEQRFQK